MEVNKEKVMALNKSIEFWMSTVKNWREKSSEEKTGITFFHTDLIAFLDDVLMFIREVEDTAAVLGKCSKLGQLLTGMCRIPSIIIQGDIYKKVLQCVLSLAVQNPADNLEERASQWALSILRKTCSYYGQEIPGGRVGEGLGYTSSDYNQHAVNELVHSICEKLLQLKQKQWDPKTRCLMPRHEGASSTLQEISELCLPLVSISDCRPVIDELFDCFSFCSPEDYSKGFLDAVTKMLYKESKFEDDAVCLSLRSRSSLWLNYLPALEQEVLNFVGFLGNRPFIGHQEASRILQMRGLPQACTKHPQLYQGTNEILKKLLFSSAGSPLVQKSIYIFHLCYKNMECGNMSQDLSHISCVLPLQLMPLQALLLVHPKDLSATSRRSFIQQICHHMSSSLHQQCHDSLKEEIWFLMVAHLEWYHQSLLYLLAEDEENRRAAIDLVCWFIHPHCQEERFKLQQSLVLTCDKLGRLESKGGMALGKLDEFLAEDQHFLELRTNSPIFEHILTALYYLSGAEDAALSRLVELAYSDDASTLLKLKFVLDCIDLFDYQPISCIDLFDYQPISQSKESKQSAESLKICDNFTVRRSYLHKTITTLQQFFLCEAATDDKLDPFVAKDVILRCDNYCMKFENG